MDTRIALGLWLLEDVLRDNMNELLVQYKNASKIIKQIELGEWEFTGHYPFDFEPRFTCFTAKRKGVELWVVNGGGNCHIRDKPWILGIFSHLVWHMGAKQRVRELEEAKRRKPELI